MYKKKYKSKKELFKWKHFKSDIILWLVRWYCRYAISYADLVEIALERGLPINRSTLYRWVQEYGPELAKRIKPYLKMTIPSWRLDETYVKIKGGWHYLYRAIDKEGQTLDWRVSKKRNKIAAKKFFKKVLQNSHIPTPKVINVDKNPAFVPAHAELQQEGHLPDTTRLRRVKYLNNSVENDHKFVKSKPRYRQWYQSIRTATAIIDGMETMRMIQKGQIRFIVNGDICAQNNFINQLFGLAA